MFFFKKNIKYELIGHYYSKFRVMELSGYIILTSKKVHLFTLTFLLMTVKIRINRACPLFQMMNHFVNLIKEGEQTY